MPERRTALTVDERLRAAVAHHCDGVEYHVIASMLGINHGRVAEACKAIRLAASDPVKATRVLLANGFADPGP